MGGLRANLYKAFLAPRVERSLPSATAGSLGEPGDGMEDSTLTAQGRAESLDGAAARRVLAAWITVGLRGQVAGIAGIVAAMAAAAAWIPQSRAATGTAIALLALSAAALVDVVEHRLPNALVGVAVIPVLLAAATAWITGPTDVVRSALIGTVLLGGPLLLTHLASPSGMGFGDVKAGAVLGAALGLVNAQIAVLALFLGLSGAAGWAVAGRRRSIALGPGLVAGAVVALTVARWMNVEANR
jgi:leader peptidase (prepilin peptidase) / N-methyltransferase